MDILSECVDQVGVELLILLDLFTKCSDYRQVEIIIGGHAWSI